MSSGSHGRRRHLPSLALGPHLQRDLTPMLALGSPCPQGRMAAGATFLHWRWGPTSSATLRRSSLSDRHVLRFPWPQAPPSFSGSGAPPPAILPAHVPPRSPLSPLPP